MLVVSDFWPSPEIYTEKYFPNTCFGEPQFFALKRTTSRLCYDEDISDVRNLCPVKNDFSL
jgi:hypothetical protein